MPELPPGNEDRSADRRLVEDLAAGRTIALSREDWADPSLRERLPELLRRAGLQAPSTRLRLAGHEVLGELGSGGMSTVYLARNLLLDRLVALKVVHGFAGENSRQRQRVLREARAMASLSHPNIVRVFEVLESSETLALAMEWVDGMTLSQLLTKLPQRESPGDVTTIAEVLGAPAAERDASATRWMVRVIRDVALAVEHVHGTGLLHLDIKPSNVLLQRNGTPLLSDFGVVRDIDLALTNTGSFAGTPVYAAPEQFQQPGAKTSVRTDVYGLGITLYEALARTRPLEDGNLASLLKRLEAGRIPRLSERCQVAPDLENIVHKAIEADPARRYQSAAELAADLTAFLANQPVMARRPGPLEQARRWVQAEPWKAAAIAVAVVALPTIGGLTYVRMRDYPKVAAAAEEARREQALGLLHRAVQSLFCPTMVGPPCEQLVAQAYALAPDMSVVVAAHAIYQANDRFDAAAAVLARHPDLVSGSTFLRMLERRIRERRCAFTPEEYSQLATSRNADDLLALCIDQARWERLHEQGARKFGGAALLERARLFSTRISPLMLGLSALLHAANREQEVAETLLQSLRSTQGDTFDTALWVLSTTYFLGKEPNLAAAREWSLRFPGRPEILSSLFVALARLEQWDEAEQLLNQPQLSDEERAFMRLALIADGKRPGDQQEAGRAMLAASTLNPHRRLIRLSGVLPVEELLPSLEATLDGDVPELGYLMGLCIHLDGTERIPGLDAAVLRTLNARPPLHARIGLLSTWRPSGPVAQSMSELLGPIDDFENLVPEALGNCVRLAAITRRWQDALRCGSKYEQVGRDDPRYASNLGYLAIAAARVGDEETFRRASEGHQAGRRGGVHFAVFLESAQQMLRQGEGFDPVKALRTCQQLETMVKKRGALATPWFDVVRAEAEAANGNAAAAAEWAEKARAVLEDLEAGRLSENPLDHWAAPDDLMERVRQILDK